MHVKRLVCGAKAFFSTLTSFKNFILFLLSAGLFWFFLIVITDFQAVGSALSGSGNIIFNLRSVVHNTFSGFTSFSRVTTVLISVLFGLNLVAFKEVALRKSIDKKYVSATTGGLVFSFLGAGCGACGVLAISFLSFFGMGALVSALPFGGAEFDLFGIVFFTVSLIFISSQLINKNNRKISYEK